MEHLAMTILVHASGIALGLLVPALGRRRRDAKRHPARSTRRTGFDLYCSVMDCLCLTPLGQVEIVELPRD